MFLESQKYIQEKTFREDISVFSISDAMLEINEGVGVQEATALQFFIDRTKTN